MSERSTARPQLDTAQLRGLLDELATTLDNHAIEARIYLLGGAALALAYYDLAERALTQDVDAWYVPDEAVSAAVRELAEAHGLPDDWLNGKATLFVPAHGLPDGSVILQRGGVRVEVAPPRLLLAMKLRAARYGRDDDDIAVLLRTCAIRQSKAHGPSSTTVSTGRSTSSPAPVRSSRRRWASTRSCPPSRRSPCRR